MSIESFTRMMRETKPSITPWHGPLASKPSGIQYVSGGVRKPGEYVCSVSDEGVLNITKTRITRCVDCIEFDPAQEYAEDHGNGAIETLVEPPGCKKFQISFQDDTGFCSFGKPKP